MMWHGMDTIRLVKQDLQLYVAAVVSIISRCGLRYKLKCIKNQSSKSKIALYKLLKSPITWLYRSNKMDTVINVHVSRYLKEELVWAI